jgi:hypothetical protein
VDLGVVAHLPQQPEPVDVGQAEVEDHATEALRPHGRDR